MANSSCASLSNQDKLQESGCELGGDADPTQDLNPLSERLWVPAGSGEVRAEAQRGMGLGVREGRGFNIRLLDEREYLSTSQDL